MAGTPPSAPHDQRTRSGYIFGAICPAQGTGAGLILPRCNIAAMALHLAEISQNGYAGSPYCSVTRSGRLAPLDQARHPRQYHPFAKLKTLLRQVPERTRDGLWQRIGALLDLFTPEECDNYLRAAGYADSFLKNALDCGRTTAR